MSLWDCSGPQWSYDYRLGNATHVNIPVLDNDGHEPPLRMYTGTALPCKGICILSLRHYHNQLLYYLKIVRSMPQGDAVDNTACLREQELSRPKF